MVNKNASSKYMVIIQSIISIKVMIKLIKMAMVMVSNGEDYGGNDDDRGDDHADDNAKMTMMVLVMTMMVNSRKRDGLMIMMVQHTIQCDPSACEKTPPILK